MKMGLTFINSEIARITVPTPFPVGPINMYLILKRPYTLIDVGPLYPQAQEIFLEALRELNLKGEEIERVLLTHAHPDHIGMVSWIIELTKAKAYLHPREIHSLKTQSLNSEERAQVLTEAGIDGPTIAKLGVIYLKTRERFASNIRLDLLQELDQKEIAFEDGSQLIPVETPGHSPGHVCFYDPIAKVLFSGDHVLEGISPNPIMSKDPESQERSRTMSQYLQSLEVISKMDIEEVYPGHGETFEDLPRVLEQFFYFHSLRENKVLQLVDHRKNTAYGIAKKIYPSMEGMDVFLGVSKVIGHLDLLVDKGEIQEVKEEGISYFYKI